MCRNAIIAVLFSWFCNDTAVAQNHQVFFGNLHSHTSYSDGSGTPDDAFRHARNTAGLDFQPRRFCIGVRILRLIVRRGLSS